ncbi:MAG: hypothetical protein K9K67_15040 [Bacteriovoracaceae bacterium]|nr:hypothetical protein [Bacteriovoracaceae bacterium]
MMSLKDKTGIIYLNKKQDHFEALNSEQKSWVARVLIGTICSDMYVQEEELIYIAKAIDFLESREEKLNLIEMVKSKTIPKLPSLKKLEPNVAIDLLFGCANLIAADKKINAKEMTYLEIAGHQLGFEKVYIHSVINWAINLAKIKRIEKKLRSQGVMELSI